MMVAGSKGNCSLPNLTWKVDPNTIVPKKKKEKDI
jgi:hypothetical protein